MRLLRVHSLLQQSRLLGATFLLILLALLAGWIVSQEQKKAEVTYTVLYNANGYTPTVLQVPLGSRVTFQNVSPYSLWTASNPYPTHSDYPAFDTGKALSKGQSYTFQFLKSGTFGFQNDRRLADHGIILVIDADHPLPVMDKSRKEQLITRDKLLALFDAHDPTSIFTVLNTVADNEALSQNCHEIGHDLGHKAYELYGFSTAMTLNIPGHPSYPHMGDLCAGGYMHGILEELLIHQPDLKNTIGTICSTIPVQNRDSCFHGIGHGLMFVNNRDVPTSLADCQQLQKISDQAHCFEGVWMEMFWGDTGDSDTQALGWPPDQPLSPCISAPNVSKPACFLYANLGYLRLHPKDFTGAVALCRNPNLSSTDVGFCMKGIGMTMMQYFLSHRLQNPESFVAGLDAEATVSYYKGLIAYGRLSSAKESDLQDFCTNLSADKETCLYLLKTMPL
jgi:plastocyanin